MLKSKKTISKTQLIQWINTCLPSEITNVNKIEQLGNGVAYLYILNYIYPGCLNGVKYCKKPRNQYDNLNNLKLMVSIFQKIGIKQPVDISKLAKMKLQDNLVLAQWFNYHSLKTNQMDTSQTFSTTSSTRQNQTKIVIPEKLKLVQPDRTHKIDGQFTMCQMQQPKSIMTSSNSCLNQIKQIISDQNFISNQDEKLNKIKEILLMKKPIQKSNITNQNQNQNRGENKEQIQMEIQNQKSIEKSIEKSIKTFKVSEEYMVGSHSKKQKCFNQTKSKSQINMDGEKSQSLQSRYQEYLKSSHHPKKGNNVKIQTNNIQHYQYEQQRLTDNSILLNCSPSTNRGNSCRKSILSETDLLQE